MLGGMTDQVAALGALKRYFGYDSFRPGQSRLVDAILAGRDVLGVIYDEPDTSSASGDSSVR